VWNSVRRAPKELQQQQQQNRGQEQEEMEPDVEGNAMLEGVILPAFENVRSSLFRSEYD
jgi:hypothetical protein